MAAVGRPRLLLRGLPHDPQLVHQPSYPLGVDGVTLALELFGQATIAVRRPLPGHLDQGVQKRSVLVRPGLVVRAAAGHAEHLAELIDWKLFTQQQHHFSFLVESEASLLEAFFKISFSRVMRPSTCSRSAIRACSAERAASLSKTRCALSRKVDFHSPSRFAPSVCLRHTSACDWTPVNTSRTTCALNSWLKCRRFAMSMRPPSGLTPPLCTCPVFGAHYKLYHLSVGTYVARDQADLEEYLDFLGSRLV